MSHLFIVLGAAIAAIAVAIPIAAMFLVSVASRREESGHTLSGHAPGAITGAARRLLAYRADTGRKPQSVKNAAPQPRSRASAPPALRRPAIEPVTISLAPDPGQDWREPAGTHAA